MSYQISKYDAIKAVLRAEECENIKLVDKLMQAIRRAARYEIKSNIYADFYIFSEREYKYFENAAYACAIISSKEKK